MRSIEHLYLVGSEQFGLSHPLDGRNVFVLRRGQVHIKRADHKLSDFVMPETFFETNEFMWERDYLKAITQ